MKTLVLLIIFLAAAAFTPAAARNVSAMPLEGGAMDRNITVDLTNDGDYEVRHVYLAIFNEWRRDFLDKDEITLDGPLKPGQTRKLSLRMRDIDPKAGLYYVLTWQWDDKGGCSEGSRFPDQGSSFTVGTGKAKCKSGKTPPQQMRADKLADSFEKAEQNFRKQLWNLAVLHYSEVLAIEPANFNSLHHRAHSYQYLNQPDKAIADFTAAIALRPQMAKMYNDRALTHAMKKDYESAAADFTRALAINPDVLEFLGGRSMAYCLMGKKDLAAADEKTLIAKGAQLQSTCESRSAGTK